MLRNILREILFTLFVFYMLFLFVCLLMWLNSCFKLFIHSYFPCLLCVLFCFNLIMWYWLWSFISLYFIFDFFLICELVSLSCDSFCCPHLCVVINFSRWRDCEIFLDVFLCCDCYTYWLSMFIHQNISPVLCPGSHLHIH